MNSTNRMKEVIQEDFNQTENYVTIMSRTNKAHKKILYNIVICSLVCIMGITLYRYFPLDENSKLDPYFITSVYAEDKEYSVDENIIFDTIIDSMDATTTEFHDIDILNEKNALNHIGDIEYYKDGYQINLKITGKNIEKVTYKVISNNDTIELYRGVSGELQYIDSELTYPGFGLGDGYDRTAKKLKDLTQEEIQLLLELSGYSNMQAKELSEKQLFNLFYHNDINFDYDKYLEAYRNGTENTLDFGGENMFYKTWYELNDKSKEEADKILGHFDWDFVERGKEITIPQKALDDRFVLYIAGVYEYDRKSGSIDDNKRRDYLKQLSEEMKIEIDIVYKNGAVITKTLSYTFQDLGKNEFGDEEYGLEGTLE